MALTSVQFQSFFIQYFALSTEKKGSAAKNKQTKQTNTSNEWDT